MKIASIAALGLALLMGLASLDADAKRLGSGKSTGMQRDMPARTAPDSHAAQAGRAGPAGRPGCRPERSGGARGGTQAQLDGPAGRVWRPAWAWPR
jgi:hypothetical protein